MNRDYNRFRILYYLYDKHYNMQFGSLDIPSMRIAEDLKYIPEKSFLAETIYLQRKGFIEGNAFDVRLGKVRISAEGIDVIDQVLGEYMKYLSTKTDDESKYQYRHLSALGDSGDDDAVRSQLYYYIKQREAFFKHFLSSSNIFRQRTSDIVNFDSKVKNTNDEKSSETATSENTNKNKRWDAFISHASEDKDTVARPLYTILTDKGLDIWYDEATLKVGDSLRKSIDHGLSKSVCGIVILSKAFFSKEWPQHELNGLFVMATSTSNKIILPVWHDITKKDVLGYSPMLADIVALSTKNGMDVIGENLAQEIRKLKIV